MNNISIEILYEDNHLIAVNKKAGEIVQGDKTGDEPLSEKVKKLLKIKYKKPGNVFLGTIHRIDRPTSGIIIFAKTSKALSRMNEKFRENEIHKTYLALAYGKINKSIKSIRDELTYFENKKKITQKAISNIKIIKSNDELSYVELNPITGRKHQLRKQLLNLGNPIVGDDKYFLTNFRKIKTRNLMLHAYKIKFMINNVKYNFKAKYNNYFEQLLKEKF